MACDKDGNTGSQFFVTFESAPCLDGTKHTIIGRVLKGKETI
jgi:cyclophilin family peptidyl-prolyl cis-trans isomerase